MFVILLLVLQIILGNVGSSVVHRIINGYKASIEDFPFIVALQREGKRHCGGSIIAPDIIVTAAHCVEEPPVVYSVIAGAANLRKGGVRRRVVEITIHPGYVYYEDRAPTDDLAVIRLESPLNYVEGKIENVKLPEYSESVPLTWGKVAGWGKTYDAFADLDQLRAVDQEIFCQEFCKTFDKFPRSESKYVFCAGHPSESKDSCNGDSGGPFVIGNTLYGVVSDGPDECATGPGIYTNIPYFVDWIKEVAKIQN